MLQGLFAKPFYFTKPETLLRTLLLVVMLTGCAVSGDDAERLAQFPAPATEFQQHVQEVRAYLLDTRMGSRSEQDVEWSLPFELKANPCG